ncbi:uncharacterized protein LODBEIA_P42970 [Lodderomyces beijingensis]|uniref:Uncharacterized protein n=1 Tax=Lodderomyces beijingensis TaxID=1775926 RepID=A0ABP0ZPI0_9ASCO
MFRTSLRSLATARLFHTTRVNLAKGDSSTIDSFKLPSQTSINEWEFKYDFIPKTSQPKVPPVTKEAVKQDIAHEKAKSVERELFAKESNSSVKVEANDANVVHGGEDVGAVPELHEDRGNATPVDVSRRNVGGGGSSGKPRKSANHDRYVQSSVNPKINEADVVNLGDNEVDHKTETVGKQTPVVDDIEHDNLTHQGQTLPDKKSDAAGSGGVGGLLVLLGLGGAGYWYYSSSSSSSSEKPAKK